MSNNGFCADIAQTYGLTGSLTASGPPAVLGTRQLIPAGAVATVHGYLVTSTGVLVGNSRFYLTSSYDATLHSSFGLAAESGEQEWVLVGNPGALIPKGSPVKWVAAADSTNPFYIAIAAGGEEADMIIGVTQFEIPAASAAYVLMRGVGVAKGGAAVGSGLRGDALTMDASAPRVIESTGGSISFGRFLADVMVDGTDLAVYLNCRGV